MRGGIFALHLTGQTGQAIQQGRLRVTVGSANGMGQFRQLTLGCRQHRSRLTGRRQAQQGGHAVGFNLQHPLHQSAQTSRRQIDACEQQHARKAIGMNGEVGIDGCGIARYA